MTSGEFFIATQKHRHLIGTDQKYRDLDQELSFHFKKIREIKREMQNKRDEITANILPTE